MQSLETALKSCRAELKDEKAKLHELKEHFKYNLKLINDRDAELQRYDALFCGNGQFSAPLVVLTNNCMLCVCVVCRNPALWLPHSNKRCCFVVIVNV